MRRMLAATQPCTTLSLKVTVSCYCRADPATKMLTLAVVGDTAIALLKAGAATDKRDLDGYLALDLAPDKEVRRPFCFPIHPFTYKYLLSSLRPCRFRSILNERLKMKASSFNYLSPQKGGIRVEGRAGRVVP